MYLICIERERERQPAVCIPYVLTKAGYSEAFESLSSAVCIYEDRAQRARREGLGSLGFGDPTG